MGTDIHSVAQVKINGTWQTVKKRVAGDSRSYNTFAVLADVRNGVGFAGIKIGEGFDPISEPKGYPSDFLLDDSDEDIHLIGLGLSSGRNYDWADPEMKSRFTKDENEESTFWMGEHSHSWHTLEMLNCYILAKQNNTSKLCGYLTEDHFIKTVKSGFPPTMYCGDISGHMVLKLKADDYELLKKENNLPKDKNIHIFYEWDQGYLDCTYLTEIAEVLNHLAKEHNVTEDYVRLVFGFDS